MREKTNIPFRLFARAQIADRNGMVRFTAVIHRPKDHLDRSPRSRRNGVTPPL